MKNLSNDTFNKANDKRPVAIYRRVSTTRQGQDGLSLDAQKTILERAVMLFMPNNKIIDYFDVKSGKNGNRAGYQSMTADIRRKRFSMVLAVSADRLCRNTGDFSKLISSIEKAETSIYIHELGICSLSPAGKLILQMVSCVGEFETAQVSERTKRAHDHQKRLNQKGPGSRPFGWNVDKDNKLIVNYEEERLINIAIAQRNSGSTWRSISEIFNSSGITPVSSKVWTENKVRQSVINAINRRAISQNSM